VLGYKAVADRVHALYLVWLAVVCAFAAAGLNIWATATTNPWPRVGSVVFYLSLLLCVGVLLRLRALERHRRLSYTILGAHGVPVTVTHADIRQMMPESRARFFERHPDVRDQYNAYVEAGRRSAQQSVERLERALAELWGYLTREGHRIEPREEWITWNLPWQTADHLASQAKERRIHRFVVVQADGTKTEYKAAAVDTLSDTQRASLLALDPAIKPWWQGKPEDPNQAWQFFRLPGGHWVSRDLLQRTPQAIREALWHANHDILEWFLEGQSF
jgi:hypothetical protein